jgi:hypothetical protein
LQKTPFGFDVSVWEFFWPLMTGARLVVAKPDGHRDPAYLVELVRSAGITTMHFVPSMLQLFLEHPEVPLCTSVRRVICSGEALPTALLDRFMDRLPAELHNLYGPTEAAVDVSWWAAVRGAHAVPIGRPIANTQLYVLDRSGNPLPVGVPGELHIGGIQLARGYLAKPDLTAEKFVPNAFGAPGSRLYRTGDLARYRADGNIEYLGRIDHQVKLRGFRIELGDIESALLACPGIREAVVLVREDVAGDKRLVAYLVGSSGGDAQALKNALRTTLPEYMVPSSFMVLDALPLTASGKVDRKALPAPEATVATTEYVAPKTPLEELLAEAFENVLSVGRVGIHDDFFALGGHSLLVMKVIATLRSALEIEVGVRDLFDAPTVERLALKIAAGGGRPRPPPIARTEVADGSLASFSQEFVLRWEAKRAPSPTWTTAGAVDVEGSLDASQLEGALRSMLARQEALLQTFDIHAVGWAPRLCRPDDVVFAVHTMDGASPEDVKGFIDARANATFPVTGGPLIQFDLLQRGPELHTLVASWHQLVHDSTSFDLVVNDLFVTYAAQREQGPALAPLPIRYVDYARWERAWFEVEGGLEAIAAGRERLAGATPLDLGGAPPSMRLTSEKLASDYVIDGAVAERFGRLCRAEAVTPFIAFSAVMAGLLSRRTGQDDIVFTAPINLRHMQPEVETLAGRFVNLVPVRVSLAGNPTWRELFVSTRAAVLDAYAGQTTPIQAVFESDDVYDHPLGRVLLNIMTGGTPGARSRRVGELTLVDVRGVGGKSRARNEVFFAAWVTDSAIFGQVGAAADRHRQDTVTELADQMRELITTLEPTARVRA